MDFEPRQMTAFLAVVEHGTVGRAAEALHLTQSALSRTIQKLETQLAAPLFERHPTGMELTVYGRSLLPHVKRLRSAAAHAVEDIDALRGLSRGVVRVGAVASVIVSVLPMVIHKFVERWPGLEIRVVEAVEDALQLSLVNGDIDLAIGGQMPPSEEVVRETGLKFEDTLRVVASTSHPLFESAAETLTVEDLAAHAWALPPTDSVTRQLLNALLEQRGLTNPRVAVETRSVVAIKALVARSNLLGWLPDPLYEPERAAGLIGAVDIEGLSLHRRFYVHRRTRGFLPPAAAKLLDELRAMSGTEARSPGLQDPR